MAVNKDVHSATKWSFHATISGDTTLDTECKQIIIGGAGTLYAFEAGGAAEKQVGNFAAGAVVTMQTLKIGTSTSATDITVLYN